MANKFFAGFDRSTYPGDAVMTDIIRHTNIRWAGFYLAPAPSHPDTSWMSKRAFLQGLGFGLAPLYVGQQVAGPGSHHVSAAHGTIDAQDAAALAAHAGFPHGSIVFLDIEQGPPADPRTIDYYKAWVAELAEHTNYSPGVYCSFLHVADTLFHADSRPVFWVFNINRFTCIPGQATATRTLIPPDPPFPEPDPAGSGVSFARLWQMAQSVRCAIHAGPTTLTNVDFDSSVAADPSNPASYPGAIPEAPSTPAPMPMPVSPLPPSPPFLPGPLPMPIPISPLPPSPPMMPAPPFVWPLPQPQAPWTPVPVSPILIPAPQAPTAPPGPQPLPRGRQDCCSSILGLVSIVATTATVAITSITAIAGMGCQGAKDDNASP